MYLVVQVRPGAQAGVAHKADHIAAFYTLPPANLQRIEVAVERLVVESMVDDHMDAIAVGAVVGVVHHTIAGRIDLLAHRCGEIHARMELHDLVDGVQPLAEAAADHGEVLVADGLYGRDTGQHVLLPQSERGHLVEAHALHHHLLGDLVQSTSRFDHAIAAGVALQSLVSVDAPGTGLPHVRWDRVCFEDHPIDVVITAPHVIKHTLDLLHLPVQQNVLGKQLLVLAP